jgi:hypothetical protein
MRHPRFPAPQGSDSQPPDNLAPKPDAVALLREVDIGIETIETTLAELEQESARYRHRLVQISGAATLFDEAGLGTEATAMHGGEQSLAAALTENERRQAELTNTLQKLRAAREQIVPSRATSATQLADHQREATRGPHVGGGAAGATTEHVTPPDNQNTVRVAPPLVADQRPGSSASQTSISPTPVRLAPVHAPDIADTQTSADDGAGRDATGRRRKTLIAAGMILLVLLTGGGLLAALVFGGDDDDGRTSAPVAAATKTQALTGASPGVASATSSAVAGAVGPSPTATESPALVASPALPLPTPTAQPATVPAAQPTAIALETVVARVIDAESALQTGQIDAAITYSDGTTSSTHIRFDFGVSGGNAKVAMSTTYQSGAQTKTTEQIMVGAQVWERVDGGNWQEVSNVEGVWGQVQAFLPRMATVPAPLRENDEHPGELHWYDSGRNADVTLQVDPDSGEPEQMRTVARETGSVLTITYTGWNTPTQIDPPVL